MPGLAGRGMVPEPRFEERPGGPRIVREVLGPGAGETSDTASAPAVAPPPGASRSRLAWSTAIFSLATGISRVLGLVREVVAKNYFGVQGPVNAFQIAFLVPNTIRALVADAALSSAFVPVFSDLIEKGERKRAWRVASSQARFRSPFSIRSLNTGTKADESAASATNARIVFGTRNAIWNAFTGPCTPK